MLSLTYLSRASAPWTDPQLALLLQRSRARNERSAITGMLLYCEGTFVQTLEGPGDEVDAMFTLIDADPRHGDVFIVRRDEISKRAFVGWYMGYSKITPDEVAQTKGFNHYRETGRIDGAEPQLSAVASFHHAFHAHTG